MAGTQFSTDRWMVKRRVFYYYFPHCCDKLPNRSNPRKEGFTWLKVQGYSPSWWGRPGRRSRSSSRSSRSIRSSRSSSSSSRRRLVSCIHSEEAGRWILCSAHALLILWSRTPAYGMVPPTFRVGLSCPLKLFGKHPLRHTQRCVSMVLLNPIRLTVKIITSYICRKLKTIQT